MFVCFQNIKWWKIARVYDNNKTRGIWLNKSPHRAFAKAHYTKDYIFRPNDPFEDYQIHKLSNKGKIVKTLHGGQNKYKRILELRDAQRSRICPTHVSKFCNALFQFKWMLGDQMNNFTNFYHFLLSSVKVKVSQVSQLVIRPKQI